MRTAEMRQALHEFINQADDRVLKLIYGMMKADTDDDNDYMLSDAHRQILDERLAAHEAAPTEGSSWEDVKSRLKKNHGV